MAPREPRRSASDRGYDPRWTRASRAFLARYPYCGMRPHHARPVLSRCVDTGQFTTRATLTDHVVPHRGDPRLFWDEANWQALCRACHAIKTAREPGGSARRPTRRMRAR